MDSNLARKTTPFEIENAPRSKDGQNPFHSSLRDLSLDCIYCLFGILEE